MRSSVSAKFDPCELTFRLHTYQRGLNVSFKFRSSPSGCSDRNICTQLEITVGISEDSSLVVQRRSLYLRTCFLDKLFVTGMYSQKSPKIAENGSVVA
jgi:hypothetical protein